jgi:ribose 5-phosphate isomerase B
MNEVNYMVALGSDHGGYILKEEVKKHLQAQGIEVKDFGTSGTQSVDYPDVAHEVAKAVANGEVEKGILVCGTGIGISIAANKVPGIRAAVCTDTFMARMSREHNNANVLALGERVLGIGLGLDIVDIWLKTPYSFGERHMARVEKIAGIEKKYVK